MKLGHVLFSCVLLIFLSACGYKPSSTYAKNEIYGKVFVELIINLEDPRNTVLVKDALHEILVHRLGSKLVFDRSLADTVMNVKLKKVSMTVLQDDEDGYNKVYEAVASVFVEYQNAQKRDSFTVSGDYEFSVDSGTTITDTKRYEAIKNAASEALEEAISKIAVKSLQKK